MISPLYGISARSSLLDFPVPEADSEYRPHLNDTRRTINIGNTLLMLNVVFPDMVRGS